MTKPITVDVYADIACPWCYIGEARLDEALAQRPELDVALSWQPFQLQPQLPPDGLPWRFFAERKFGGWDSALRTFEHVAQVGEEAGVTFNFTDIARANNTADAHRLVLKAQSESQGMAAAHALFRAYFAEGKDLNDREVLLEVARTVGLNEEATQTYLESGAGTAEVEASQRKAAQLGISGVPFYVFNDQYGVSGAQPVEAFLKVLEQLSSNEGMTV